VAIRDSDENTIVRITDESDYTDECKRFCLQKSVKSKNPWQSVIQTKIHLSESRMNRITRITQMNSESICLKKSVKSKNPWQSVIQTKIAFV